ncbi:MAG: hypothetical protein JNM66_18290 [Bryobacterales bacterium]|nr:hypothetical protein [Bryobacterales bacterium]
MDKPARPFRNLGLSAVALCLAASFGFSISAGQPSDRVTRQQQRSRAQRQPRHRVCPGLSQEPCALQVAFVKSFQASDPPPAVEAAISRPLFQPLELAVLPAQDAPVQPPVHPRTLPRPPPART